jgi:hypothetical protein
VESHGGRDEATGFCEGYAVDSGWCLGSEMSVVSPWVEEAL